MTRLGKQNCPKWQMAIWKFPTIKSCPETQKLRKNLNDDPEQAKFAIIFPVIVKMRSIFTPII